MRSISKVSVGGSRPEAEVLPAQLRSKAAGDVERAVSYYTVEADAEVATRFVDDSE